MTVTVAGAGPLAEAHAAWYSRRGCSCLRLPDPWQGPAAPCDLVDLCPEETVPGDPPAALAQRSRAPLLIPGSVLGGVEVAARLARAARRARRPVVVTGGWRLVPAFARLSELTRGGILGSTLAVAAELGCPRPCRESNRLALLDLLAWLLDDTPSAPPEDPRPTDPADRTCLHLRGGTVDLAFRDLEGTETVTLTLRIEAANGWGAATARFPMPAPGRPLLGQDLEAMLHGRRRRYALPGGDPGAAELGTVTALVAAGEPLRGLCLIGDAARLLDASAPRRHPWDRQAVGPQ